MSVKTLLLYQFQTQPRQMTTISNMRKTSLVRPVFKVPFAKSPAFSTAYSFRQLQI